MLQVMLTYFDDVIENFTTSRAAAYMCVHKLNSLAEVHSVRSTFEWGRFNLYNYIWAIFPGILYL